MSIFDIFRAPFMGPRPAEMPPMSPCTSDAAGVKKSMHEMLMVCLAGGMAYEDAKIAANKEYGMALQRAEALDQGRMKRYLKDYEDWKTRMMEKK